jgi:metal-sulfur cluster biosynthetic enzyme
MMSVPLPVDQIYDVLRTVDDPEIGINIVDLGFIYAVESTEGRIYLQMSLTSAICPMRQTILDCVRGALKGATEQTVEIDTDSAPAWTPARISPSVMRRDG